MATFLMMMATLALLKIKVFWVRCYDVIVSVHGIANKILWSY